MPKINFNGKTYNSVEEMPANERQAFEKISQLLVDKNRNGIPDFLEGDVVKNVVTAHSTQAHITVNGKTYTSFNDLPPEMRQQVDGAFQMLSNMGILQDTSSPADRPSTFESKPFEPQNSAIVEEDSGRSNFVWVLSSIMLCLAIVVITIGALYLLNR